EIETAQSAMAGGSRGHLQYGRAVACELEELIRRDEVPLRKRCLEPLLDHELPVGGDILLGHRARHERGECSPDRIIRVGFHFGGSPARGTYQQQLPGAAQLEGCEVTGSRTLDQAAVEAVGEGMRRAVDGAPQVPAAGAYERVRPPAAGVAERVQTTALGTHHEHTLTRNL